MKRILKALLFVVVGCIIGFFPGSLNMAWGYPVGRAAQLLTAESIVQL